MPWQAQKCVFCQKCYANKASLSKHLRRYIGRRRLPADGIHDVLQIQRILHANCLHRYRCWTCEKILDSRAQFREHVIYLGHCDVNSGPNSIKPKRPSCNDWHEWKLPFEEELVLVQDEPKVPFPFLRLPTEVRLLIYQLLLCAEEIKFGEQFHGENVDPPRDGLWLQHNPPNNPLAIMSVSRQVYNEARGVFYSLNKFTFEASASLLVFLIGIGRKNVMLLRSVWHRQAPHQYENVIDKIRSCLSSETAECNSWDPYRNLLSMDQSEPPPGYWENKRLERPDPADWRVSLDRWRYKTQVDFWKRDQNGTRWCQNVKATYELCVLRRKDGAG